MMVRSVTEQHKLDSVEVKGSTPSLPYTRSRSTSVSWSTNLAFPMETSLRTGSNGMAQGVDPTRDRGVSA